MNLRRVALAGMLGAMAYTVAASRREPCLEMHRCDWYILEDNVYRRRFESPGHFIHHLKDLLSIQVPVAEVYLLPVITAAFRERIMLVTAFADECSW